MVTSVLSGLACAANADSEANGRESGSHVPPVSDEYLRVWSELSLVRRQLCYFPTNREFLASERFLAARLKELEP